MTEVFLHGILAKKFNPRHEFENIHKATDCIHAIDANYDGFTKYLVKSCLQEKNNYQIIINGIAPKKIADVTKRKKIKRIDIMPELSGALDQLFAQFLMQVALAGVQSLLSTVPEDEVKGSIAQPEARSFLFASEENLAVQYAPVPLGYGALRIGSKVIETFIKAVDLNSNASNLNARESESAAVSRGLYSDVQSAPGGGGAAGDGGNYGGGY
tara:strand:+ start:53 stop:691 length:639 start_codon:yes stop_codon:yes gene_type:complete